MRTLSLFLATALLATMPVVASAQAAKIAVVNAAKVFADMKETATMQARLEEQDKELTGMRRDKQERIKKLQQELDQLKPDSPQYVDKGREMSNAMIDLRTWQEVSKADLERALKLQTRDLFRKITAAVAAVAKDKGIDLVLATQGGELPPSLEQITVEQLRSVIKDQNVLYSSGATDLTADVTAKLDADYQAPR